MGWWEAPLNDLVEKLGRVPDRYRHFTVTADEARWRHGVDADLLGALTDLGMRCDHVGGAARYDDLDLANASLSLRLPSPRSIVMRGWAAAIRTRAAARPTTYTVSVGALCQHGPADASCSIEASVHLRDHPGIIATGEGPLTLTHHVPAAKPQVYPQLAPFTELIREVRFHLLPDGLRDDVGFLRETGLADCALASAYLVAEAHSRELVARLSYGLFLSAPYSIVHTWVDLHMDGQWVPFDPHLLNFLVGWGLIDADEWPPYRSIPGAACRLGEREFVLATHNGEVLPLSFPTTACDGEYYL
ncbi:transglutaminase domain-containing protein [Streptomyces sp. ICN988]|uniref:transglutaminase domain-containing protein n=1 Tax=Streptomyces sp. ICN988 TaxID=2983765 RepID=UPI0021E37B4D|nr:transglutaminase domain-containing protein [Streptomyces sp. ICN988]MCV2458431.1 transglutaminase domain-containing protein [Streptomyces sp. ICN988]